MDASIPRLSLSNPTVPAWAILGCGEPLAGVIPNKSYTKADMRAGATVSSYLPQPIATVIRSAERVCFSRGGADVVTQGCGLVRGPEKLWTSISALCPWLWTRLNCDCVDLVSPSVVLFFFFFFR